MPFESAAPLTLDRRRLLGIGVGTSGALLLAGCTGDDPEATPSAAPSTIQEPADADTILAAQIADLVARMLARVDAAGGTGPQARRRLKALRAMHRAHLSVLEGEPSADEPALPGNVRNPNQAVAWVRRAEQKHAEDLVAAAVAARSGALARLLASMSASTTQHLEVLA